MASESVSRERLQAIFARTRTIAIVGLSPNPQKASHGVAKYLQAFYRIIPVNPNYDSILGEPCYRDLASIPIRVDLVDVFQRPERVAALVPDTLKIKPYAFWMQLGISHEGAAAELLASGIEVIQDRCTKIDHQRVLSGG